MLVLGVGRFVGLWSFNPVFSAFRCLKRIRLKQRVGCECLSFGGTFFSNRGMMVGQRGLTQGRIETRFDLRAGGMPPSWAMTTFGPACFERFARCRTMRVRQEVRQWAACLLRRLSTFERVARSCA